MTSTLAICHQKESLSFLPSVRHDVSAESEHVQEEGGGPELTLHQEGRTAGGYPESSGGHGELHRAQMIIEG